MAGGDDMDNKELLQAINGMFAEFGNSMDKKFDALENRIDGKIDKLESRLVEKEVRFIKHKLNKTAKNII